jgi:hypothetical protein
MPGGIRVSRAWRVQLCCGLMLLPTFAWGQERTGGDVADLAAYDALVRDADRDHWSFRPVRRPAVPQVNDPAWVRNPIAAAKASCKAEFLAAGRSKVPSETLAAIGKEPALRTGADKQLVAKFEPHLSQELAAALPAEVTQAIADWERATAALRQVTPDLPRGYFLHELGPEPAPTHLLVRGKAARPGPAVAPGLPAVLVPAQPSFLPPGRRTRQRRLTLARWIASKENPLTARVIVNRVWQHHFGEGLVRTPSEFGRSGDPPTHPELLDWLANWFVHDAGWSLKKLHHLIMTSNSYRMSKQWNAEYGDADPENRLLWRQNYRRLEVETIRDSMLAVSGQLNPKMFGPSMYPHVPKAALEGHSDPDKVWKPFDEAEASRRTVYAFIKRSLIVPLIDVLDFCDPSRTAPQRLVTSVAPQALSLFNGEFVNQQARHLADRLVREVGSEPERQIERAYLLALCRPPTPTEQAILCRFLDEEAKRLMSESAGASEPIAPETARQLALKQMCRTIFNLNEFVYAD